MSAVLAIMEDWFRRIRSQASFKLLIWAAVIVGLGVATIKIERESVELFFTWHIDITDLRLANPGEFFRFRLLGFYVTVLPFFAFIIILVATGGAVPDAMRKGRIDAVLARPVTRFQFALGNYLGGLLFVAAVGAVLVCATWVGFALRGTFLHPAWFLTLPLLIAKFAVIYAIAVPLGIWLKSTSPTIILTFLAWFLGSLLTNGHDARTKLFRQMADGEQSELDGLEDVLVGPWGTSMDVLYWIFPKAGKIDELSGPILRTIVGEEGLAGSRAAASAASGPDWWPIALSSLGLIAAALLLSARMLRRRDL